MNIDLKAVEFAVAQIDDGEIFEKFATSFLCARLGHEFIPVGGSKDRGVDAFLHVFSRSGNEKLIYQMSTEVNSEDKINNTIKKLRENNISFDKIIFVTNRKVNQAERIIDDVLGKDNAHVNIYDLRWFIANANYDHRTIKSFQIYIDTYLHQYAAPGKITTVANLDQDARLYVFLEQQFSARKEHVKLDDLLADTLILYSLEGTDPEKEIFRTLDEIKTATRKHLKFDPRLMDGKIEERLEVLSTKPRKIKCHVEKNAYCLPFETRSEIEQRNLKDGALHATFYLQTEENIKKYFGEVDVTVKDVEQLITSVFKTIFSKQGLDFSNFVLHGVTTTRSEQRLSDVIASTVDDSPVVLKNKEKVKVALNLAVRDIVYNGTPEQQRFLRSLSNTYLMMFLLQFEPKIATYFQTLAAKMKVFVDNSIIIPALSERYLPKDNQRHWNLLKGADEAGVEMLINETILDELASHFRMLKTKYNSLFKETEKFYLSDEYEVLYIDEIVIRAYFHAKQRAQVSTFDNFINNFVDPSLSNVKQELITFLKETFNITHVTNKSLGISLDFDERKQLTEVLREAKSNEVKAETDAGMILTVYQLRETGNEQSKEGIFGYRTWWLSKDTNTYKAVVKAFGDKYPVSCYIRPDFIYNYIALRPTRSEIENAYADIFPTMLGVNLSYHISKDVAQAVQGKLQDYNSKDPIRVNQILRNLSDRLKTDPTLANAKKVELFLDDELKKLDAGL